MAKKKKTFEEEAYASDVQFVGVAVVQELQEQINKANEAYSQLVKCGLKKEAEQHILPKIRQLEKNKLTLKDEIKKNQRLGAKALLMCFTIADLAADFSDNFSKLIHEISYGVESKRNEFGDMLLKASEDFGKIVEYIDEQGNLQTSQYYADMAEECKEAARIAMIDVIDKWMATKQGERYF